MSFWEILPRFSGEIGFVLRCSWCNAGNQLRVVIPFQGTELSQMGERFHKNVTGTLIVFVGSKIFGNRILWVSKLGSLKLANRKLEMTDNRRWLRVPVPWGLYLLATVLIVAVVVLAIALQGTGTEGLRFASRYSARVSFSFFLVAFSASALARFVPGAATSWLLLRRRHLGLAFAWAHLLHLGIFVTYFFSAGTTPPAMLRWV